MANYEGPTDTNTSTAQAIQQDEQIADSALAAVPHNGPLTGASRAQAQNALSAIENTEGFAISGDLLDEKAALTQALAKQETEQESSTLAEQIKVEPTTSESTVKQNQKVFVKEEHPDSSVKELIRERTERRAEKRTQKQENRDVDQEKEQQELTREMFMLHLKGRFKMKKMRPKGTPASVTIDGEFEIEDEKTIELIDENDSDPRLDQRKIPIKERTRVQASFKVIDGQVSTEGSNLPGTTRFSGGVVIPGSGKIYFEDDQPAEKIPA